MDGKSENRKTKQRWGRKEEGAKTRTGGKRPRDKEERAKV
jgi:hypothetical protein